MGQSPWSPREGQESRVKNRMAATNVDGIWKGDHIKEITELVHRLLAERNRAIADD